MQNIRMYTYTYLNFLKINNNHLIFSFTYFVNRIEIFLTLKLNILVIVLYKLFFKL